jgi:Protein of unknown function (DUF3606)
MNQQGQVERPTHSAVRPATIDARNGSSVVYWTSQLKCSWPQLDHAVKQVGNDPAKVKAFLSIE